MHLRVREFRGQNVIRVGSYQIMPEHWYAILLIDRAGAFEFCYSVLDDVFMSESHTTKNEINVDVFKHKFMNMLKSETARPYKVFFRDLALRCAHNIIENVLYVIPIHEDPSGCSTYSINPPRVLFPARSLT